MLLLNFTILMIVGNYNLLIETFQKDTINDSQETNNNDENCNVFGENK